MQHLQDARSYQGISFEARMMPYSEVALVGGKECGFVGGILPKHLFEVMNLGI